MTWSIFLDLTPARQVHRSQIRSWRTTPCIITHNNKLQRIQIDIMGVQRPAVSITECRWLCYWKHWNVLSGQNNSFTLNSCHDYEENWTQKNLFKRNILQMNVTLTLYCFLFPTISSNVAWLTKLWGSNNNTAPCLCVMKWWM